MYDLNELCRKLKPIVGEKVEQLSLMYLTENQQGKRDIEEMLKLLAAKVLGSTIENPIHVPRIRMSFIVFLTRT